MNRESNDERIEDALRARASLEGDAAGGADEVVGPGFGSAYRLGGLKDYGEDFAEDDEALDEGVEAEDDEEGDGDTPSS